MVAEIRVIESKVFLNYSVTEIQEVFEPSGSSSFKWPIDCLSGRYPLVYNQIGLTQKWEDLRIVVLFMRYLRYKRV